MRRITTLNNNQRMSTQELLVEISQAVANGETEFQIQASGQHDIGGPLWNAEGKPLLFSVTNPGQRVGSMCLPGTSITVHGSAPADVGWLNSGGIIAIRGDAGDTAGHCAASGIIYIGGRAGTRSGSLMKHDPQKEPPELWVLNSVGSFSFEFMSGGTAIVCGHESQTLSSILGERPCVGMVGGVVYFRGPYGDLPSDVAVMPVDERDVAWLEKGIDKFLSAIDQARLKKELSLWKHWRKLVPVKTEKQDNAKGILFLRKSWPEKGLFGDIFPDDNQVIGLVASGSDRQNEPFQLAPEKCEDCRSCLTGCPQAAIRRRMNKDNVKAVYSVNSDKCIGCGLCVAICPASVWSLRPIMD